ncbi:MAG: FliH/SctL family protein [Lachnospiraceae bacterium]
MLSSPNLYKFNQVILQDSEARVIDSNEKMAEKIAELSKSLQGSIEEENGEDFPEEFSGGIDALQVSQLLDEESGNVIKAEPVYEGPVPEEVLAQAQEQADALLEQARQEAEAMKSRAYEEGMAQGQADGYAKGSREAEALKEQLRQEYQEKEERLTRIYQEKIEEIEPGLIDVLTDIYEHIFCVKISDYRDVVVHLLGNTLRKMEGSMEYLIHVSREDIPFVSMQKEALLEAGGVVNAHFDIVEDLTLKKNQCLIETENGIFDCSLGVELKELKKQLLLLSYDGKEKQKES